MFACRLQPRRMMPSLSNVTSRALAVLVDAEVERRARATARTRCGRSESKFGNDTVEPTGHRHHARRELPVALLDDALLRPCASVHLPAAGSSVMTPSARPARHRRASTPASEPRFGFCPARRRRSRRPRPWAGRGVSLGIVLSAVVMRSGAPARNSGSSAASAPSGSQPLRRAEQLLGVVALPAHARRRPRSPADPRRRVLPDLAQLGHRLLRPARPASASCAAAAAERRVDDLRLERPERAEQLVLLLLGTLNLSSAPTRSSTSALNSSSTSWMPAWEVCMSRPVVLARPAGGEADELDQQAAQARQIGVEEAAVDPLVGGDPLRGTRRRPPRSRACRRADRRASAARSPQSPGPVAPQSSPQSGASRRRSSHSRRPEARHRR